MDSIVSQLLSGLVFGEPQFFRNTTVFPVFSQADSGPLYLTLGEAIEQDFLRVTEVDNSGSVPQLKVIDIADLAVLLLDGEELIGAKQNRILNTTILIKEKSETIIPVSCCEQGRWHYASRIFKDSRYMLPAYMRPSKMRSVSESLKRRRDYMSHQGEVWNEISYLSHRHGVESSTGAMKDVFDAKAPELDEYLKLFPVLPGQKGLMVFLDGQILGLDVIPLVSAYSKLHPKLVRSYTLDNDLVQETQKPSVEIAKAFIEEALRCSENKYPSVGYGYDFRYEGTGVNGSALCHQENVIHAAFFPVRRTDSNEGMTSYRQRVRFHRRHEDVDI